MSIIAAFVFIQINVLRLIETSPFPLPLLKCQALDEYDHLTLTLTEPEVNCRSGVQPISNQISNKYCSRSVIN